MAACDPELEQLQASIAAKREAAAAIHERIAGDIAHRLALAKISESISPLTPERLAARASEEREREAKREEFARWDRWKSLVRQRGERYAECWLATFETAHSSQRRAVEELNSYCLSIGRHVEAGEGLVLFGPKGTGKDHLVMAVDGVDARQVEARLGGLRRFRGRLTEWSSLLAVAQAAEHYVRHHGWHATAVAELWARLKPLATCTRSRRLKNNLLQFAAQQAAAAQGGERLMGSTEVLESLIGKYKRLQALHSAHGMTRTILALGAVVGHRCLQTLRAALAHVTTHHVTAWCQTHLGPTLQARRHHAFPPEQNQHPTTTSRKPSF